MKCRVGVFTHRIELLFGEEQYVQLKQQLPAPIGRRSWYVAERDGNICIRRTQFGSSATLTREGYRAIGNEQPTIVRCSLMDAEMEFDGVNGVVRMPPHHLWPWLQDARSRLKKMSMYDWRWLLVQELNARIRSATAHHVDMPKNLPNWVREMLTESERDLVSINQEIT